MVEIYQQNLTQVLRLFRSSELGLSSDEANKRLKAGKNEFTFKSLPWWQRLLEPFLNLMVVILLLATLIAWWQKQYLDAFILSAITLINVCLDWGQQYAASKILSRLRKKITDEIPVLRDGKVITLAKEYLVPGDVFLLSEGQQVPADARLLKAQQLTCDEAMLTGESLPVVKTTRSISSKKPLYQQKNLVFAQTFVVAGSGVALVIRTGQETIFGQLAQLMSPPDFLASPIKKKVSQLISSMMSITLVIAAVIFVLELNWHTSWSQALNLVIALFVGVVPEGLPIAISSISVLAISSLARKKIFVREGQALENLGLVTTIATDKTGTITKNQLVVWQTWSLSVSQSTLARSVALSLNLTHHFSSDPLDQALKIWCKKFASSWRRVEAKVTLDFNYRCAFSGNIYPVSKNQARAYLKGAPEKILAHCSLNRQQRLLIAKKLQQFSQLGGRVLAVATTSAPLSATTHQHLPKNNWRFIGFLVLRDQLRPDATSAVATAKRAGIKIKMITGDHHLTALSLAEQAGIGSGKQDLFDNQLLASQANAKSASALATSISEKTVFARITPAQKHQLITALNRNEITVMTGDGVNDLAAMSKAHVSIAMGMSPAMVKESADLVLLDNRLTAIITALAAGRSLVVNLKRMIVYLLATNVGELLVIMGVFMLRLPLPLDAVQLLWVNLLTDTLIVIPLGWQKADKQLMRQPPPSPQESLLNHYWYEKIFLAAFCIGVSCLLSYYYFLSFLPLITARTMVFWQLIVLQLANALSLRSHAAYFYQEWQSREAKIFALMLIFVLGLQGLIFCTPLREYFHLQLASPAIMITTTLMSLGASLGVLELHKYWRRHSPTFYRDIY